MYLLLKIFSITWSHLPVMPLKKKSLVLTVTATLYESGDIAIKLGPFSSRGIVKSKLASCPLW